MLFRKFCVDFAERYKTTSVQLDDEAREVLVSYPWPGNVRELKNIAEQISVLAPEKLVHAAELRHFLPEQPAMNRLPAIVPGAHNGVAGGDFSSERDILYKLFFDMKKDVTELKKMFFDILQNPGMAHAASFQEAAPIHNFQPAEVPASGNIIASPAQPFIIQDSNKIDHHEEVEETLSIADKEKELIEKALKKHKGKRKDAALDLGISERTLYRKLKEYNINE
jgi:DNA-binding NtrC family response regulator